MRPIVRERFSIGGEKSTGPGAGVFSSRTVMNGIINGGEGRCEPLPSDADDAISWYGKLIVSNWWKIGFRWAMITVEDRAVVECGKCVM